MSTIYPTEFSDISNLPKKEIKSIESNFPFLPPEEVKYEPCGQIVSKGDIGSNTEFCPICDFPMIVRIMNHPCEHVMCFECSQPEKGYCYICEEKIVKCVRRGDNAKLYECDFPDCFKFFETNEKLKMHKSSCHGINNTGMGMNFNMNMMSRAFIPTNFVNPVMGIPMNPYIAVAQNQNNSSNINQMNLNNNVISTPQNINNIPANTTS